MGRWWLSDAWQADPVRALSWIAWVIVSITLHELGHGFMALRCGDATPRALNRITLNPFVHIPRNAWFMFALFGFTWGFMPVSPSNFRRRYDDARVSAAGPAVNLGLFVLCAFACALWVAKGSGLVADHVFQNVGTFFLVGSFINLMGFVFNLIPIPPLDGWHILSDFSPPFRRLWTGQNGTMIGLIAFALLFFVGGGRIWDLVERWTLETIIVFERLF